MKSERPEAGITIDKGYLIELMNKRPIPWISVSLGDVILYLSKKRLENLAKPANEKWVSEENRIRFINGVRARKLLEISMEVADGFGCAGAAENAVDTDIKYLLISEIETGELAAADISSGSLLPHIHIHYWGGKAGEMCGFGHISASRAASRPPFLIVQWWQS